MSERRTRTRTPSGDLVPRVLAAASRLVEGQGAEAMTVRAVAEAAGVSPASLYNRFGGKQGLLDALVEAHFEKLSGELAAIWETDPMARLRAAGVVVRRLMLASPNTYELIWSTGTGPHGREAFEQFVRIVRYGQDRGALVAGDPARLAGVIWACVQGLITEELRQGRRGERRAAVSAVDADSYELMLDVIARGVARQDDPGASPGTGAPPSV